MGVKRVLINDADPQLVESLREVLERHGKCFDVLTSNSGTAALEVISRIPVDLVITGLHESKLDGFQLITDLARRFPCVKVIAMVGARTPMLRSAIRLLGADASFRKPVDLGEVATCAFAELQIRSKGEVWGIHLTSFIQMLHAEAKTCRLIVTRPGHIGRLFLEEGKLVAAEYGACLGDEAVYEIVSWDNPVIEIDYLPFQQEPNVSRTLMALLMEAQTHKDEIAMQIQQRRRHDRFNCLVAVDYDIEEGRYRHLVRDISLGGAYIESGVSVSIGQRMELDLAILEGGECIHLSGRVVRLDSHGFGIQFDAPGERELAFIRSVQNGNHVAVLPPADVRELGEPALNLVELQQASHG